MSILYMNLQDHQYPIYIEENLLKNIGRLISEWYRDKNILIVSDYNVDQLYGAALTASLKAYGYSFHKFLIPPGEQSKSLTSLYDLYNKLADSGINRHSLIIAFGGGVVGDLAGFAAATYMRGVPYIQIPTTVMAQLDSSIGGKTGINLKTGKNLVGSFYQPKAVYIDTSTLQSLSDKLFAEGLAEAVKYAAIKDTSLLDKLASFSDLLQAREHITDIIFDCARIKCDVVSRDVLDQGERMLLNFGHTIGHGIESYYRFNQFSHGEAVGLGMLAITRKSESMGITAKGTAEAIEKLLMKFNLPVQLPSFKLSQFLQYISLDKKSDGGSIRIVLLRELGNAFIMNINRNELISFIQ